MAGLRSAEDLQQWPDEQEKRPEHREIPEGEIQLDEGSRWAGDGPLFAFRDSSRRDRPLREARAGEQRPKLKSGEQADISVRDAFDEPNVSACHRSGEKSDPPHPDT